MYLGKLYYDREKRIISLANRLAGYIFRARYQEHSDVWVCEVLEGEHWTFLIQVKKEVGALQELFGYANSMTIPIGILMPRPKGWDSVTA